MRSRTLYLLLAALALAITACAPAGTASPVEFPPSQSAPTVPPSMPAVRAAPSSPAPEAAPAGDPTVASGTAAAPTSAPTPDLRFVSFSTSGWKTDFSTASVPLGEITSGGPPRDGIPPIDNPRFESVAEADTWLDPREPVVSLVLGSESRAYPLQVLIWHEIVNDKVGDTPVSVTFCPLCNTAIAFDRRVDGRVLDFGTTGNLRHSDLVMWDRQTESWWQQATGEAIVGELTGARLELLPAQVLSWAEVRDQLPQTLVLSRDTGFTRSYGRNPYVGYDQADQTPFLFKGTPDGRLPAMERVVVVSLGDEDAAYPYTALLEQRVVNDRVGGEPIVVFFQPGTVSALDAGSIADSRDVGASGVYAPEVDGRALTFAWRDDAFVDLETGSRWTLLGRATSGPLADTQLPPVVHFDPFWFAWAAFKPDVRVWSP